MVFGARGRIQSAKRAKRTLQRFYDYNLTNLLSACGADTGHERKGDFHVKATPAESQSLEQLKKQAKSLLKRQQAADSKALTRIRENHPRWRNLPEEQVAAPPFALTDAQLVIASEYGFASWSKLQSHIKALEAASSTAEAIASLRDPAGRGDLVSHGPTTKQWNARPAFGRWGDHKRSASSFNSSCVIRYSFSNSAKFHFESLTLELGFCVARFLDTQHPCSCAQKYNSWRIQKLPRPQPVRDLLPKRSSLVRRDQPAPYLCDTQTCCFARSESSFELCIQGELRDSFYRLNLQQILRQTISQRCHLTGFLDLLSYLFWNYKPKTWQPAYERQHLHVE